MGFFDSLEFWRSREYWDQAHDSQMEIGRAEAFHLSCVPSGKGKCPDIGCGAGLITEQIAKKGYEVSGVDISEKAVGECRKRGINAQICDAGAQRLPFSDQEFGLVTCFEVVEHIKSPQGLLNEVRRVLKKDGLFIISTPNIASPYLRLKHLFGSFGFHDPDHVRFYTPRTLMMCLGDFGFSVKRAHYLGYFPKIGYFGGPLGNMCDNFALEAVPRGLLA